MIDEGDCLAMEEDGDRVWYERAKHGKRACRRAMARCWDAFMWQVEASGAHMRPAVAGQDDDVPADTAPIDYRHPALWPTTTALSEEGRRA